MKKLFVDKPWVLFAAAGVAVSITIICFKHELAGKSSDILVEAVGFLGDIILFGILFTVLSLWREKKLKEEAIQRENEKEIALLKRQFIEMAPLGTEEGTLTKINIIKRLRALSQRLPEYIVDLKMEKASVVKLDFSDTCFSKSSFGNSNLIQVDFSECAFEFGDFKDCNLAWAKFNNSYIKAIAFINVNLEEASFAGADISGSGFRDGTTLDRADFTNATTRATNFRDLDLSTVIGLTQEQVNVAWTRGATLPKGLVPGPL